MTRLIVRAAAVTALLAVPVTTRLAGQDLFGSAVAVHGSDVLVVKPGANRGPAVLHVYRHQDGAWRVARRLVSRATADAGHRFGASLAVAGDAMLVAGGDPEARWAAHGFPAAGGAPVEDIPLRGAAAAAAPSRVSLAAVMRVLQPPARAVAADRGRLIVTVAGAQSGPGETHVYERRDGGWTAAARLPDGGSAVTLRGNRAAVGVPARGGGVVLLFEHDPASGTWSDAVALAPDDAGDDARFGTAVVLGERQLIVGAPRLRGGAAIVYAHDAGAWVERQRLTGDSGTTVFGSAIAVYGDEMLVGAPLADGGRGRVHRFVRDAGGIWAAAGVLETPGAEPRWALGAAVALSDRLAVVGAPLADGYAGRAAVFARREGGTWGAADWIRFDGRPESVTGGEVRCEGGTAGRFACGNVDLQAFLSVGALGGGPGESVSDLWGWTDPATGREYALVGRTGGLVFVDVTSPTAPVVLGTMPANPSGARDVKVYRDHAFLTGDGAGDHGLLVFDLTRLRAAADTPTAFEPDARYTEIASAHNLAIDTASGFAYPVAASGGGTTCGGGLHMVDIRDPRRPVFAGCYTDTEGLIYPGRTHDAQCVVYHGPDDQYRGRQICFASNETALRIVDVTDKARPVPISAASYPGIAYLHQGWLTDEHRYFYLDDELDELVGTTDRTRTLIWDLADLDDPVLAGEFLGTTGATDHNLFIAGDRMYQANYQAGLRVVDISDRVRPAEIGFFDTTPYEGNPAGLYGAWTAYPFFASGNVIVSSMGEGVFIVRPRPQMLVP